MKTKTLFATYGSVIASFKDVKDRQNLLLEDFGEERIYYAPFDYVNPKARLFIVGITPGEVQMNNMLVEAARLIHQGFSDEDVLKRCKAVGSFSGPMRKNLVELMDEAGIAEFLDIKTTAQLFSDKQDLVKISDAMNLFKEKGMTDKTSLFKYRRSSFVNVYDLNGYKDYFYGYMASSTGMLGVFDIFLYDEGIVLQLPVKNAPLEVPEFNPQTKLFNVLKESTSWAKMLGMSTVGELNDHITNGDMTSFMLTQEALQEQKIVEIVDEIKKRPHTKFIMIAGPSSSGKTTFSHRLSIQLMANGYKPHPIAVDNYFVEREQTPIDENGDYNYEDLHAVDIELFNKHMTRLLNGEKVELPEFNFKFGRKEYNGNFLQLGEEDVLVIEGIHCLNDELSYSLPIDSKFKIYISALTQLNVDEHNRVSTTDGRLLRRLVRDYRTRGASAKKTLSMWESVLTLGSVMLSGRSL